MPTRDEHFGKGLRLYGETKYEEALGELRQAVALDPAFGDAHLAIGHALHKLTRLPEAVEALRNAIACNEKEPLYHTSLSAVFRDMGNRQAAEEEMAISFQLQRGG
jgi:tetratricopeptide (TPR) repeat protein